MNNHIPGHDLPPPHVYLVLWAIIYEMFCQILATSDAAEFVIHNLNLKPHQTLFFSPRKVTFTITCLQYLSGRWVLTWSCLNSDTQWSFSSFHPTWFQICWTSGRKKSLWSWQCPDMRLPGSSKNTQAEIMNWVVHQLLQWLDSGWGITSVFFFFLLFIPLSSYC